MRTPVKVSATTITPWMVALFVSTTALAVFAPDVGIYANAPVSIRSPLAERPKISAPPPGWSEPARAFDARLLGWKGQEARSGARQERIADGVVTAIQEDGYDTIGRLEVDLDDDRGIDEVWVFQPNQVVRHVASRDDGQFDRAWLWTGAGWVRAQRPGELVVTPAPSLSGWVRGLFAPPPPPPLLRAVDLDVLAWRGRDLGGARTVEIARGKPWRILLVQEEGGAAITRARVDLDRDEWFDERITFRGDTVIREVSTADDGRYDQAWRWVGSGWAPR